MAAFDAGQVGRGVVDAVGTVHAFVQVSCFFPPFLDCTMLYSVWLHMVTALAHFTFSAKRVEGVGIWGIHRHFYWCGSYLLCGGIGAWHKLGVLLELGACLEWSVLLE